MATHLAAQPDQWTSAVPLGGAIALGYPLKPPGPRGGDRVSHLRQLAVPTLVVQGTRDTFGGPDDVRDGRRTQPLLTDLPVPTGDHSMKVQAAAGRPQAEVEREIVAAIADWMRAQAGRRPDGLRGDVGRSLARVPRPSGAGRAIFSRQTTRRRRSPRGVFWRSGDVWTHSPRQG